jgi:hypothetical protein
MTDTIKVLLYIAAVLFFVNGFFATAEAKSAIHQIYAVLCFGFTALSLAGVMIGHAIAGLHNMILQQQRGGANDRSCGQRRTNQPIETT